jgi:hypothetical protein
MNTVTEMSDAPNAYDLPSVYDPLSEDYNAALAWRWEKYSRVRSIDALTQVKRYNEDIKPIYAEFMTFVMNHKEEIVDVSSEDAAQKRYIILKVYEEVGVSTIENFLIYDSDDALLSCFEDVLGNLRRFGFECGFENHQEKMRELIVKLWDLFPGWEGWTGGGDLGEEALDGYM